MRLTDCPEWMRLRTNTQAASRPFELNACEDPIDAVLCAYIAMYAHHRPDDMTMYGDFDTGYIVTPTLPPDLKPTPRVRVEPQPPSDADHLASRLARAETTLAQLLHELAEIRERLRRT